MKNLKQKLAGGLMAVFIFLLFGWSGWGFGRGGHSKITGDPDSVLISVPVVIDDNLYIGDPTTGDIDAILYFQDDLDLEAHSFRYDDGLSDFKFSNDIIVGGTYYVKGQFTTQVRFAGDISLDAHDGIIFRIDGEGGYTTAGKITETGLFGFGTSVPVNLLNVDGAYNFFTDSSTVDDSWGFSTTGLEVLTTGMTIFVQIGVVNTDGATLQINALGAKDVHKLHNQALVTGDVEVGQILHLVYDGTEFQLLSQLAQ